MFTNFVLSFAGTALPIYVYLDKSLVLSQSIQLVGATPTFELLVGGFRTVVPCTGPPIDWHLRVAVIDLKITVV